MLNTAMEKKVINTKTIYILVELYMFYITMLCKCRLNVTCTGVDTHVYPFTQVFSGNHVTIQYKSVAIFIMLCNSCNTE